MARDVIYGIHPVSSAVMGPYTSVDAALEAGSEVGVFEDRHGRWWVYHDCNGGPVVERGGCEVCQRSALIVRNHVGAKRKGSAVR